MNKSSLTITLLLLILLAMAWTSGKLQNIINAVTDGK